MREIVVHPVNGENETNCLLSLITDALKKQDITGEVIVVVPASQTLEYEKAIMRFSPNGLLRVSVTSTKKLQDTILKRFGYGQLPTDRRIKIESEAGIISKIYMICRKEKDNFQFIRTPRISVAESIYDIYKKLRETHSPQELRELCLVPTIQPRLKGILHDLAIIFERMEKTDEEYIVKSDSKYSIVSPSMVWFDVCDCIISKDYFNGKTLIFCGFDDMYSSVCSLMWSAAVNGTAQSIRFICRKFYDKFHDNLVKKITDYVSWKGKSAFDNPHYCTVTVASDYNGSNNAYDPDIVMLANKCSGNINEPVFNGNMNSISVYHAPDQYTECLHAAQQVIEWHEKGYKWSDIGIVLDNPNVIAELLPLVLEAAGVPYFMSIEQPLLQCTSAAYVNKVITCASTYSQQDMLDIIKSGYIDGITSAEASLIENYAITHGIKGSKWLKPFVAFANEDENEIERLNEIKDRAITPIVELHDRLKKRSSTLREQTTEIYYFLERTGYYDKLKQKSEEYIRNGMPQSAEFIRQSWESMKKYMDTLAMETYYEEHQSMEALAQITGIILYNSSVKFIPQTADAVLIDKPRMFVPESKKCCILMCQQDVEKEKREPLLTTRDYAWISENSADNKPLFVSNKKTEDDIREEKYMGVMSATEHLCVSASLLSHDGKAIQDGPVYVTASNLLSANNPGNIHGGMQDNEIVPYAHDVAFEMLGKKIRECVHYGTGSLAESSVDPLSQKWKEVFAYFMENEPENMRKLMDALGARVEAKDIPSDMARTLYINNVTSVSELESYAACPYSSFISKGLRPHEIENYTFKADQRGIFYHSAMELYFRRAEKDPMFPHIKREKIVSYFNEAVAPLVEEASRGPLSENLLSRMELTEYVQAARISAICVTFWLSESNYVPTGYEVTFGRPGSQLPPLTFTLPDGQTIALTGKIDRIDEYTDGAGNTYGRVIDYKSSPHALDREAVLNGYQLQLPLYLSVLMSADPKMKPAGALYQIIFNPIVDVEADDEDTVRKKVLETFKMSGMYLNTDEDTVKSHGDSVKKESANQKRNIMSVSEDEIEKIVKNSREKATEHAENMRGGRIAITPVTVCGKDPCKFCKAANICGIRNARRTEIGKEDDNI